MDPTDQRVAIAQIVGWVITLDRRSNGFKPVIRGFRKGQHPIDSDTSIPDYLNDRSAMHEAILTVLSDYPSFGSKFASNLQDITGNYCVGVVPDYDENLKTLTELIVTPADVLAKVFLRTLNHWEA